MIPAIAIISPLLLTKSGLLTKSIDGGGKTNDGVSGNGVGEDTAVG
jgi:hypothetical protein